MSDFSFTADDIDDISSGTLSDDDISLPPEILERERQLMERNRQLEQRVKDLMKSTIDSEELGPRKSKKMKPSSPLQSQDQLPKARQSPSNKNIIEVDVPINVEPLQEVRIDPVPELREAFHKIAQEIQGVNEQIAEVESNKSKCDVVISKLQADLKRTQVDNERAAQETIELTNQIENSKAKIQQLKADINSARLSKIDHVQHQNEAKQKQMLLEKKIKRQKVAAERIQSQINMMQTTEMKAAKISSDRQKMQQQIDHEKKALRQLKLLLSDIQRAANHEEKIFDHLQSAKNLPLSSETVERALSQLL
ncbi:hypothetical protein TRFO_37374 [Tritrichomonas foetus]|uniref:Uncharacterized protein n=1 Tax=Tritrichomonas foetus TaxID=1144522 RepID=A0A1J4JBE0_9EUKA|nr:hypothetical protein TRFO_37374 [Tritrichomonas foetus]|eukprot:OHS96456.1 hypothetical protein TRFO_37374 [Tritrichomonas foetus]